ncbi:MAG: hypothetical protein JWQ81_6324 [Amycolatopsis sp.]|jgi:alginate O-acetyltransferase complex protein AlgJ|uniref:alginate O-acetyltransferase AlgX-related protein n=1 Tax=Amycolatopsis sp. TaxID=37632 RepID=UPI00261A5264|nr:hypothetical protein [Amycolatopsis sp.]MCU1685585.1 hypothetical protein [Amycolatopsis sp.]
MNPEQRLPPTPEAWLPNEHSLYRPRHSRRQRTALTCALVFFLVPTLAFVFGVRATAFENRALRGFPSLSDGWNFFPDLSGWATDHLALRQAGVTAADGISTGVFGDPPGSNGSGSQSPGVAGLPQPAPVQPPIQYPIVIYGSDSWLYLGQDVGNKCNAVSDVSTVIAKINRLREAVLASGRQFELIVPPDKSTQDPEHLPPTFAGQQCFEARSAEFWNRVPAATGMIDLRAALTQSAVDVGHPIYDTYDTHWAYEGGVTMTYALADRLNPGITSTWVTKPRETQTWPADIVLLLNTTKYRTLRRYSLAPDGKSDRSQYVASDFRVPLRLKQPATAPATGVVSEPVGLIADSFTQFATPFLGAGFKDLTIVHPETMAQNTEQNATNLLVDRDVITVELAERNIAGGGSPLLQDSVIDAISKVLEQNPR